MGVADNEARTNTAGDHARGDCVAPTRLENTAPTGTPGIRIAKAKGPRLRRERRHHYDIMLALGGLIAVAAYGAAALVVRVAD